MMRVESTVELATSLTQLRPFLEDLSLYPQWMPLVHAVEPDGANGNDDGANGNGDGAPAWIVELRAKVGPLARSKRLRMCRTINRADMIVFERFERDERRHSPWVLTIHLTEVPGSVTVKVSLEYGGSLWTGGILDKILASQIDAGREGLKQLSM